MEDDKMVALVEAIKEQKLTEEQKLSNSAENIKVKRSRLKTEITALEMLIERIQADLSPVGGKK